MATTETPLVTTAEFERMPEEPGKQELEGDLIAMPPHESSQNRKATEIFLALRAALAAAHARGEAAELGEVFIERGYRLAVRTWVQPDVSISPRGQTGSKYFEGAPAIAIEVSLRTAAPKPWTAKPTSTSNTAPERSGAFTRGPAP